MKRKRRKEEISQFDYYGDYVIYVRYVFYSIAFQLSPLHTNSIRPLNPRLTEQNPPKRPEHIPNTHLNKLTVIFEPKPSQKLPRIKILTSHKHAPTIHSVHELELKKLTVTILSLFYNTLKEKQN